MQGLAIFRETVEMTRILSAFVLAVFLFAPVAARAEVFDKAGELSQHLEFLGYTVTEEPENDRIVAKHQRNYNFTVKSFRGGLLLTTFLTMNTPLGADRERVLEVVNKLNADAEVVRYYLDSDEDLAIEGWFPGAYDKTDFGLFLENYNHINDQLSGLSDEEKAFFK
jgi:hypothetical protein